MISDYALFRYAALAVRQWANGEPCKDRENALLFATWLGAYAESEKVNG